MKKLYFLLSGFCLLSFASSAQTLNTGDIVVIGYAADTGTVVVSIDEFSWVPLVNLTEGTKIYFTDAGYNTIDGDFMGEGLNEEILLRYIVPAGGVLAGTVFTVTEALLPIGFTIIPGTKFGNDSDQTLSLPNAGEQITVFQSTDDEFILATFGDTNFTPIFMVTGSTLSFTALNSSAAGITPSANIDNLTNLVPGLTDGVNAVAVGTGPLEADETDNARYTGTTTGTREEILFAVSQLSNWSRHDAAFGNDLEFGTTPNGWTTNNTALFTITTLGIPENNLSEFTVFPNPTKDWLEIKSDNATINSVRLFDSYGRMIVSSKNVSKLDLSHLSSGIYFLEIESETHSIRKKIIKE